MSRTGPSGDPVAPWPDGRPDEDTAEHDARGCPSPPSQSLEIAPRSSDERLQSVTTW